MSSLTIMLVALLSVNSGLKRKPRPVKNATERSRSRTGRLTKIWMAIGRSCLLAGRGSARELRLRAIDHPRHAVAVDGDAVTTRPEGFLHRHVDAPTFTERRENALGRVRFVDIGDDVRALDRLVRVPLGGVGAQQREAVELEPRMHDQVARGLAELAAGIRLAEGHHRGDAPAEHACVERERVAAVAVEAEIGVEFHGCSIVRRRALQPRAASWLRRRSSCSRNAGVSSVPKSSASNTWRISISDSP